jgi:hypothetical protein
MKILNLTLVFLSGSSAVSCSSSNSSTSNSCVLTDTYTFSKTHGLPPNTELGTLTPPARFTYESSHSFVDGGSGVCTPLLPACDSPNMIDIADIVSDLANADVQNALAQSTTPIYGSGGEDANSLSFTRAGGGSFALSGSECTPASATCVVTPSGVHLLLADLEALVTQSLADPGCQGLEGLGN